jgi:hypothetical protein
MDEQAHLLTGKLGAAESLKVGCMSIEPILPGFVFQARGFTAAGCAPRLVLLLVPDPMCALCTRHTFRAMSFSSVAQPSGEKGVQEKRGLSNERQHLLCDDRQSMPFLLHAFLGEEC